MKKPEKIIDFRCRPLTKGWLDYLQLEVQPLFIKQMKAEGKRVDKIQTPDDFLKEMNDTGTTIAVMLGTNFETTLGQNSNPDLMPFFKKYPDRMIPFVGVDPNKKMGALKEMDKYVKMGYKGVNVVPSLIKVRSDDRLMYPIYARCVEYGIPIVIHTGPTPWGIDWTYMEYSEIMPLDRVATDFPELVIIASHLGIPWVGQMLNVMMRHPNVYVEVSGMFGARDMGINEPYLKAANGMFQNQFLYGSAKPYATMAEGMADFMLDPYTDEVRKKIAWDNPARILKLDKK
jgi:predicted TIM-barrel fold metal-dependent hydrolase